MYNASQFIKQCIVSILNQTYKNFELLIINDGSTDNSLEICNKSKIEELKSSIKRILVANMHD